MHIRISLRNLALASAVAAMLAAAAPKTIAQVPDTPSGPATPPTSTPPGPTSVTPDNSNTTTPSATTVPMSSSSMPMTPDSTMSMNVPPNFPTNYSILNNRVFDNVDLEQSRARGLSDSQIATIIKISRESGYSYPYISGEVERGKTFPELASDYNLKISDVYDNSKELQDISDYSTLYKTAAGLGKNSSMMAMPMSSDASSMTPPTTMAPPVAPMAPTSGSVSSNSATLDIVETAMAAKNLTTLVKALQIAGLVDTLKGAGPFTVFAPDDKAFSKLPAGALDALEADPTKLKQVLTYHVIPGAITASDAMSMTSPTSPPTVEGATLQVTKGKKGRLKVNDATVTKADIQASNGVIHIINMVLMPPTDSSAPASTDTTTPSAAPAPMDATPPAAPGATPTPGQ